MAKKFYKAVWSTPTTDYEKGPDSVGPMVDRLAQAGFDLIIPVVKGGDGYVNYHSMIAKPQPKFESWDPLALLAQKANGTSGKRGAAKWASWPAPPSAIQSEPSSALTAMDSAHRTPFWRDSSTPSEERRTRSKLLLAATQQEPSRGSTASAQAQHITVVSDSTSPSDQ